MYAWIKCVYFIQHFSFWISLTQRSKCALKFLAVINKQLKFLGFCINIWFKRDDCENVQYVTVINN
jgi:hypothetical protein